MTWPTDLENRAYVPADENDPLELARAELDEAQRRIGIAFHAVHDAMTERKRLQDHVAWLQSMLAKMPVPST